MPIVPRTVRDHHGQSLPLFAPHRDQAERADFPDAEFRVLQSRVREGSIFEMLVSPLILWGIVILTGIGLTYRASQTGGLIWPIAIFVGVALLAVLTRGMFPPASARHIAGAMLELGRCPSCGFALATLQPEADRCVICPECGGAWVLPKDIFADQQDAALARPPRPDR